MSSCDRTPDTRADLPRSPRPAAGGRRDALRGFREWLDQGDLQPHEVHANLRDLELINRWLGGARSIVPHALAAIGAAPADRAFHVLDIACGGGDLLRSIAGRARQMGRSMVGLGADANEQVLAYARETSAGYPELDWIRADALALPFGPRSFDLVMCSCFMHHLEPAEASTLLSQARKLSRRAVMVGDLVQSRSGAVGFRFLCRLARLHPVTRHDGLVSLQRAYRPHELADIALAAGFPRVRLHRHAFCRATLVCEVE